MALKTKVSGRFKNQDPLAPAVQQQPAAPLAVANSAYVPGFSPQLAATAAQPTAAPAVAPAATPAASPFAPYRGGYQLNLPGLSMNRLTSMADVAAAPVKTVEDFVAMGLPRDVAETMAALEADPTYYTVDTGDGLGSLPGGAGASNAANAMYIPGTDIYNRSIDFPSAGNFRPESNEFYHVSGPSLERVTYDPNRQYRMVDATGNVLGTASSPEELQRLANFAVDYINQNQYNTRYRLQSGDGDRWADQKIFYTKDPRPGLLESLATGLLIGGPISLAAGPLLGPIAAAGLGGAATSGTLGKDPVTGGLLGAATAGLLNVSGVTDALGGITGGSPTSGAGATLGSTANAATNAATSAAANAATNAAGEIVVQGALPSLGLGSLVSSAVPSLLGSAAQGSSLENLTNKYDASSTPQDEIVVTGAPKAPSIGLGDLVPSVAPSLPSTPTTPTETATGPQDEIVVSGSKPSTDLGDLGPLAGGVGDLGDLANTAGTEASTNPKDAAKDASADTAKGSTLDDIVKYLKLAGLGTGLLGDLFGGSKSSPTARIPAGLSGAGGLGNVFTSQLPSANLPGIGTGGMGARTAADLAGRGLATPQDYYRYGYGPEQSFFSNAPQGAQNTSRAFTGYEQPFQGIERMADGGSPRSTFAVGGPGDGREDKIPAMLSDGEYVIDAETVALLGNGSSKAGANALDKFRVNVRKHKGQKMAKGDFSVKAKKPEQYLQKGRR